MATGRDQSDECVICQQPLGAGTQKGHPYGSDWHTFHDACITQWHAQPGKQGDCPVCNAEVAPWEDVRTS